MRLTEMLTHGTCCEFFPLNKKVAYKQYSNIQIRDKCWLYQQIGYKIGRAPKPFKIVDRGEYYGYITEIVETYRERLASELLCDEEKLDEYYYKFNDIYLNDDFLKRKEYYDLVADFSELDIDIQDDMADFNLGWKGNTLVPVDFDFYPLNDLGDWPHHKEFLEEVLAQL